jgi:predicted anti-sigma-YlaC factor YlaD
MTWSALRSCREASRLAATRCDRPLSLTERIALTMHLGICRSCRRFARQVADLDTALRTQGSRMDAVPLPQHYAEAAKDRLRQRLRDGSGRAP